MRDQAEELRIQMLLSQRKLGRSIAVVSGKGGVGKSNFSINFTAALSSIGNKVVLIDMDIGMGNVHVLLGKTAPTNLKDYLLGKVSIEEVLLEGPNNLHFISGGSGLSSVMEWDAAIFTRLIQAFVFLQKTYDFIVFDMGAGATAQTLELLVSVDDIIVISTSEPTSITDAYSMMKFIHTKDSDKKFYLLCNRAFTEEEGRDTNARLQLAMSKFLSKEVVILGSLPEDPSVRKAVKEQVPFSILYPHAEITKKMNLVVNKFSDAKMQETDTKQSKLISRLTNIFFGRS